MNIITKLNIRQKVMLALTILAAAFLAWQIYNFVHGNTAPSKPVSMGPASKISAAPVPAGGSQVPMVQPLPVSSNLALVEHQQQYLNLVREYQITKMKRQVVEEEASLANAQKRISDAGRNGALVGLDTLGNDDAFASGGYQLAYLDRQAGRWTATIAQGNQYKEVHIGTRLADGSRVIAVSGKGVVLQPSHGKNITLGFQGSVNVDNDAVPAATVKAHSSSSKKTTPVANNLTATVNVAQPNHAKIAKMLGITAAPKGAAPVVSAPSVVKSTTDIPAAPLANSVKTVTITAAPTAPVVPPAAPAAAPEATATSTPNSTADSAPAEAAPSAAPSAPAANANDAAPTAAPEATTDNAAPSAAPQAAPEAAVKQPATAPEADNSADQSSAQTPAPAAPVVKPVSVKELREHNAEEAMKTSGQEVALGQISWQQAADLSAAISDK